MTSKSSLLVAMSVPGILLFNLPELQMNKKKIVCMCMRVRRVGRGEGEVDACVRACVGGTRRGIPDGENLMLVVFTIRCSEKVRYFILCNRPIIHYFA